MDKMKAAMLAVAVVSAAVIATDADAHGRGRYRSSVGIYFGAPAPLFFPYHYYPRYYYPPAVLLPAPSAPVYIEQSQYPAPVVATPAQASGAYWYFCRDTQIYYPYVQQCATPWEQVVPQGAPPS